MYLRGASFKGVLQHLSNADNNIPATMQLFIFGLHSSLGYCMVMCAGLMLSLCTYSSSLCRGGGRGCPGAVCLFRGTAAVQGGRVSLCGRGETGDAGTRLAQSGEWECEPVGTGKQRGPAHSRGNRERVLEFS